MKHKKKNLNSLHITNSEPTQNNDNKNLHATDGNSATGLFRKSLVWRLDVVHFNIHLHKVELISLIYTIAYSTSVEIVFNILFLNTRVKIQTYLKLTQHNNTKSLTYFTLCVTLGGLISYLANEKKRLVTSKSQTLRLKSILEEQHQMKTKQIKEQT